MAEKFAGFSPELFAFLDELKHNNDRDWFNDNKDRYEEWVREPSLAFVRAMGPRLKKLSAHFVADDRRSGGSLMRIYRDTRFGKDKTPYKTNVGIQFRHEMGKDVHAPGFYVHLASEECFLGVGVWCPESSSLRRIRDTIVDDPALWKRTRDNKKFNSHFFLGGDSLKTAPRGFAKDHPLIDDLRRTSFIGVKNMTEKEMLSPTIVADIASAFTASRAFVHFLCDAIPVPR